MSSTSLYGNVGNVTVSSQNLTTLYNATPGNTVIANVPDRNFTTLYAAAGQTNITPTKPYGNSNVESFLNAGTDGANVVHNINMNGQLTVGGQSYLGNVGNVHITGGNSGYVLTTNGVGNLIWAEPHGGSGSETEFIHFDVTVNGNNQTFTNTLLENYANANVINLFKNGVNIEPTYFDKPANNSVQVNIPLAIGDTIDILASAGGGGGGLPAGIPESVQFNTGYEFGGDSFFLYNSTTHTLTIPTVVGNLYGLANEAILSNTANFANVANTANTANTANFANVANSANTANTATFANTSELSNIANIAYSVDVGNVVGIGNIATINLTGSTSTVLYGNGVFASVPAGTPAGANTSIQFNGDGSFAGDDYFTYAYDGGTGQSQLNIGYTGFFSGGSSLSLNGKSGNTQFVQTGINGGMTITVNGSNSVLTINAASTTLASNLTVQGMTTIQEAKEKFTSNGTGATGTVVFDVLTDAIILQTANASANFTLNIRGNSTTTFDSITSNNESTSITFINKNGATGYYANVIQIDGSTITPVWVNGVAPYVGTTSGYDVYNFNILKTGTATYSVFGAVGSYK